ncbi:MAG: Lrp/AsnC ligand binding domain-containing protein [Candidatus Bathyarchaeia archaeon]
MIKVSLAKAIDDAAEVGRLKGVRNHCAVTGAFDVIATFGVKDLADAADVVVKGIHQIEGVCRTQTAICVRRE